MGSIKGFVRHLSRKFGFDIRWAQNVQTVTDFIKDRQIEVILDVGANVGQFGSTLRSEGYRGKIISFEPVSSAFQALARVARKDSSWEAHHFALGAAPGEAVINVAEYSVFSSILDSTDLATQFDKRAATRTTETIEVRTLDEVAGKLAGKTLLKIDTQGYEKQVLDGGRQVLNQLEGVLMELPIIQLWEHNWQFHEAVEFMASVGFVPAQIHPVNYDHQDRVSLVEVDCLFRPRNSR